MDRRCARNPRIQNMLRMIGYGENLGSGFPKIVAAWKEADWGEPVLKNMIDLDEVELVLPLKKSDEIQNEINTHSASLVATSLKTQQKTQQITTQKTTQKTTRKTTQKTTQIILAAILENASVTRKELADLCGISSDGIKWQLKQMQEKGIIRRVGPDKGGHWEVIKE